MSGRFLEVDRDTAYMLPPSVQEWVLLLPQQIYLETEEFPGI